MLTCQFLKFYVSGKHDFGLQLLDPVLQGFDRGHLSVGLELIERLLVEVDVCLELGAAKVAAVSLRVEYFSTASKNSYQVCVLVLARAFSNVVFAAPLAEVSRTFMIGVHNSHLFAFHLHAVTGEDIDDKELLVWTGLDLLPDDGACRVHSIHAWVVQPDHVFRRELSEIKLDQIRIVSHAGDVADCLLDLHDLFLLDLLPHVVISACSEDNQHRDFGNEWAVSKRIDLRLRL